MNEPTIEIIIRIIKELGIPVAIIIWFAWRDSKFLGPMQQTLAQINLLLQMIHDSVPSTPGPPPPKN